MEAFSLIVRQTSSLETIYITKISQKVDQLPLNMNSSPNQNQDHGISVKQFKISEKISGYIITK